MTKDEKLKPPEEIDVQRLMEKYDTESRVRRPVGIMAIVISVVAISMSVFQFYTSGFGSLLALKQRAVHLAFALSLTFLIYPRSTKEFLKNKTKIPYFGSRGMFVFSGVL